MKISLNGDDWLIKDFVGEDWLWRDAHKPGTRDGRWWRPGRVPGSVHDDLWRNGELANPYVDRNSLLCEWVAQRTWIYNKTFAVDALPSGGRAVLRFDGVDYAARFYLNGELIGHHASQFVPARFEVTDQLRIAEPNLIAVVLDAAPAEQPQVGYTKAVRTRKTRMNYWWDFCPRLVHLGLWRDVSLELTGAVRIEDVWARSELSEAHDKACVTVTARISSTVELDEAVEFSVWRAGQDVVRTRLQGVRKGASEVTATLDVPEPALWWPNGMGERPLEEPALYEAEVRVGASDAAAVSFGIRNIELTPNADAAPAALPYTFTVTGQAVYANGWNWVPLDVLYGVPRPAKLKRLLTLAQATGVNLLRVWGGGLIESQAFYDECDRRGIMVWQEFIQSSSGIDNNPPDNATTSLLHSEFGAEGAANLKTIEAVLPEDRRWPATRENASWFHSAAWWIREPFLQEVLGAYPQDLESFVEATQYLQASALQYALEANRRRWPRCSGSLPWQFNEPFPNVFGTPAVDYFGEPKPAYFAVKRAYAPVAVTARFMRQAWSDGEDFETEVFTRGAEEGWTLSTEIHGFDGARWDVEDERVFRVPHEIFLLSLRLQDESGTARAFNRYLFTRGSDLAELLKLPMTELAATVRADGDRWQVTVRNVGEWAALGVWLEDARPRDWNRTNWTLLDDNYVHLLPGEEWTTAADWDGAPADEGAEARAIEISAMNARRITVQPNTEVSAP